jgi:hypothetical protein
MRFERVLLAFQVGAGLAIRPVRTFGSVMVRACVCRICTNLLIVLKSIPRSQSCFSAKKKRPQVAREFEETGAIESSKSYPR